jgi:hypothetical protein
MCDESDVCVYYSTCKVWKRDDTGHFQLAAELDVEKCSFVFGVDSRDFNKIRKYLRDLEEFKGTNCGTEHH